MLLRGKETQSRYEKDWSIDIKITSEGGADVNQRHSGKKQKRKREFFKREKPHWKPNTGDRTIQDKVERDSEMK